MLDVFGHKSDIVYVVIGCHVRLSSSKGIILTCLCAWFFSTDVQYESDESATTVVLAVVAPCTIKFFVIGDVIQILLTSLFLKTKFRPLTIQWYLYKYQVLNMPAYVFFRTVLYITSVVLTM